MSADATATLAATLENVSLDAPSKSFNSDSGDVEFVPGSAEPSTPTKEGRRVHLRNIAYATDEGELKKFFHEFEVTAVKIPVNPRTSRPLGYAFVDLATPELAEKAIADLNGKELADRVIVIDRADGRASQTRGRGTRGRGRAGRTRGRGGHASTESGHNENSSPGEEITTEKLPLSDITNKSAAVDADGAKSESRKSFRQTKRGAPEDGIPSTVKIMVANIPFSTTEKELEDFFQDYEPQVISIALRPIPHFMIKKLAARQEPRKGRGFAFITLSSHEMQEKACAEKNGVKFQDREIAVKVAIDTPEKAGTDEGAEVEENGENQKAPVVAAATAEDDAAVVAA